MSGTRKSTPERRSEIVDASMRLIATEGARRFTARAIGRAIGTTDAAIFKHFASMDAIVDGLVDRMEEILFSGFPPVAADPIDRLRLFFEHRVSAIEQHPELSRLLLSNEMEKIAGAGGTERIARLKKRSREFVRSSLRQAERAGLLAHGVGPEEAAILVLGAIHALVHARKDIVGRRGIRSLPKKVWQTLERLLRGRHQISAIEREEKKR